MKRAPHGPDVTREFEALLENPREVRYVLRLFVRGTTRRSLAAVASLKSICKEYLHGRYDLEIIDVQAQPQRVREDQILALPTLVRKLPQPMRHYIGDLADKERVLAGLEISRRGLERAR